MNMEVSKATELEKIREQFNYGPYPRTPLDKSPKEQVELLYLHNFVTPYYLRHRKVIDTKDKIILDAGCGSGYNSLVLAEANPGAKIVGIDLSEESVALAQQRLQHHGFDNVEFHVLLIEDLPQLGMKFDYINCDEVLYLLGNPAAGLKAMKSVLQPDGIIRANLHSLYQRASYFRAQTLFKFMGLMDESPKEFEEEAVIETMNALKDGVRLKAQTWDEATRNAPPESMKEILAMNFLFVGDTGYTVPDLFDMLDIAGLDFVSMLNWRRWDVTELFQDPENMPALWQLSLAEASDREKHHLFELLNPIHRLIDFWCAPSGEVGVPVDEWSDQEWWQATVHLHPQLRTEGMKENLIQALQTRSPFEISQSIKLPALTPIMLDPTLAACLLPLWEGAQPLQTLVKRYQIIQPTNLLTLEPTTEAEAFEAIKDLLNRMDAFLYVLVEQ